MSDNVSVQLTSFAGIGIACVLVIACGSRSGLFDETMDGSSVVPGIKRAVEAAARQVERVALPQVEVEAPVVPACPNVSRFNDGTPNW